MDKIPDTMQSYMVMDNTEDQPEKKKTHSTAKKWNWELFQALYFGGMEASDIIDLDEFDGLGIRYAQNVITSRDWAAQRKAARNATVDWMTDSLVAQFKRAEEIHTRWLLERLDKERQVLDRQALMGGASQKERLDITAIIDTLARKQLRLDEAKPITDQERQMTILVYMNGSGNLVNESGGKVIENGSNPLDEIREISVQDMPSAIMALPKVSEQTSSLIGTPLGSLKGGQTLVNETTGYKRPPDQKATSELKPAGTVNGDRDMGNGIWFRAYVGKIDVNGKPLKSLGLPAMKGDSEQTPDADKE